LQFLIEKLVRGHEAAWLKLLTKLSNNL